MEMLIEPPDEIKTIIDKTASFVAKVGPDFEKRIWDKEQNNPKFSFLQQGDSFHEFYQERLRQARDALTGQGALIAGASSFAMQEGYDPNALPPAPPEEEAAAPPQPEMKEEGSVSSQAKHGPASLAYRSLNIMKRVKAGELQLEAPPVPQFTFDWPPGITPLDLDVMKLTAQFISRNGHQFQVGLLNRESRNAQFDFLKQSHPHYAFFMGLVESYTRCLVPPKNIKEKLVSDFGNKQALLERIMLRNEYLKEEERKRKAEEEKVSVEKMANVTVDWHDFIVVETIDFDEEDHAAQLQLQQQQQQQKKATEEEKIKDVDMETEDMEVDELPKQKAPSEMRIRKDYVKPQVGGVARQYQRCPRCGQDIPVEEMDQHMRIELLDPKYRHVRQTQMERSKTTSIASDDDITRNLNAFARRRTDIFGVDEVEPGKTLRGETEKKEDKVLWDGHTSSIPIATGAAAKTDQPPPPSKPPAPPATSTLPPPPKERQPPPPPGIDIGRPPLPPPPMSTPAPPPAATISRAPVPAGPPGILKYLPPGVRPPPQHQEEPAPKKLKTEESLIPEEEFLSKNPATVTIQVQLPEENDKPEWKLNGQILTFENLPLKESVTLIKKKIQDETGLPSNKQKLKVHEIHLKDNPSLAFYNISNGSIVYVGIKSRGGKR